MSEATTIPAAPTGEIKTKPQVASGGQFGFGLIGMADSRAGNKPDESTYEVYRRMLQHPTVALGRAAALSPIKAAEYSWASDDNVPDEMVETMQTIVDPHWSAMIRDLCSAIDFGFTPFERVWDVDASIVVLRRLKPLDPAATTVLVDESGNLAGLKNGEVTLDTSTAAVYTNDKYLDDWYGRSRLENIRSVAYEEWMRIAQQQARYYRKHAGIVPIVRYPQGVSMVNGTETDNFDIARSVMEHVAKGGGVTMPNELASDTEELSRRGGGRRELSAWAIEFMSAASGAGAEFLDGLRYYDSLMLRGLLVPERAVIEGQHGTLAEAGAHANIALNIAEATLRDFVAWINANIVDPLVAANYGSNWVGSVRIEAAPLVDERRVVLRRILEAVLTNPGNIDLALAMVDFDSLMDSVGVPKAKETVDNAEAQGGAVGEGQGGDAATQPRDDAESLAIAMAKVLRKGR